MVFHTKKPQHTVVHDRIDVRRDRIVSSESQKGPPLDFRIGEEIPADEQALVGVTGPDPLVPLDTVYEENAAAQAEGVLRHLPDPIQSPVTAAEGSLHRNINELVDRSKVHLLSGNESIPNGTARTPSCLRIRLPAVIAVDHIQRFFYGLTAIDADFRVDRCLCLKNGRKFRLEFVEPPGC